MDRAELSEQMRRAFFHNIYGNDAVEAFVGNDAHVVKHGQSAAALHDEGNFIRTYWYIESDTSLAPLCEKVRKTAQEKPFISEIIYPKVRPPEAIQCFLRADLREYSHLIYMTRTPAPLMYRPSCQRDADQLRCERAGIQDTDAIHQLLESFDPLVSHLPDQARITDHILNGEVAIIRGGSGLKILSAAFFQKKGMKTRYLYQIVTAPDARRRGLAGKLLEHELEQFGCQYVFSLWVEEENVHAVDLYEKCGFVDNGRRLTILRNN